MRAEASMLIDFVATCSFVYSSITQRRVDCIVSHKVINIDYNECIRLHGLKGSCQSLFTALRYLQIPFEATQAHRKHTQSHKNTGTRVSSK